MRAKSEPPEPAARCGCGLLTPRSRLPGGGRMLGHSSGVCLHVGTMGYPRVPPPSWQVNAAYSPRSQPFLLQRASWSPGLNRSVTSNSWATCSANSLSARRCCSPGCSRVHSRAFVRLSRSASIRPWRHHQNANACASQAEYSTNMGSAMITSERPASKPLASSSGPLPGSTCIRYGSVPFGCLRLAYWIQIVCLISSMRYQMRPPPVTSICHCGRTRPSWRAVE